MIRKGEVFPLYESSLEVVKWNKINKTKTKYIAAQYIGEIRKPKTGEWFISGAVAEAYLCNHNFASSAYHICKLVIVTEEVIIHKHIEDFKFEE